MDPKALGFLAAGIGAGITVIGAGIGIGKLAAAAMEASGRQPEVCRTGPYPHADRRRPHRRRDVLRSGHLHYSCNQKLANRPGDPC